MKRTLLMLIALAAGCGGQGQAPDAGTDLGADAGRDAGDAPGDAGGGGDDGRDADGSGEAPWDWCPASSDYVGGSWPTVLRVTGDALYCATFDETRTLEEELPVKSRLRIIAGDYPVPDAAVDVQAFVLPVCLEFREPGTQPALDGVGNVRAWYTQDISGHYYHLQITVPLLTEAGQPWELKALLTGEMLDGDAMAVVDGTYLDPWEGPLFNFYACTDCEAYRNLRWFASCHFDTAQPQRHTVTFQGGEVELYIQMGDSGDSTEPAAFVRATGTLDGTPFEQTDYYSLIYNPEHHHFERDFAVLFDDPIGGACGLKIQYLDPWNDPPPGRVFTVGCDLAEIEERQVTGEDWERL